MIIPPSQILSDAIQSYADLLQPRGIASTLELDLGSGRTTVPLFSFGQRQLVLLEVETGKSIRDVAVALRNYRPAEFDNSDVFEIIIGVGGRHVAMESQVVVERGIRALSLHNAIAEIVGLPKGWYGAQVNLVKQTLQPVRLREDYRVAKLRISGPHEEVDADTWLANVLAGKEPFKGKLTYIRAEGGKGKSTLLANFVRQQLDSNTGSLLLFVPLRDLHRGAGVSWDALAASLGVVDTAATDLARAVRSGLVVLFLDGLDEVAGRYDPNVVGQVISLVSKSLLTKQSLVVISGRTTEGTLLDPKQSIQVGIELPDVNDEAFRD